LYVDVFTHSQLKLVFNGKFPDLGSAVRTLHSFGFGVSTGLHSSIEHQPDHQPVLVGSIGSQVSP
jgi:hypothetical protein